MGDNLSFYNVQLKDKERKMFGKPNLIITWKNELPKKNTSKDKIDDEKKKA